MKLHWDDVNARAAGLGSRLLSPEAMAALADAGDLQRLSRGFAENDILPDEIAGATAPALERGIRRAAGRSLAIARRWLGERTEVVVVVLETEDRRSLRALTRGAAAGVRADARLAGMIPTPTLPERLLEELAALSSIREQAALLAAAGHPYGSPILAVAAAQEPDLFAVELAIARTFAMRALRGARRGGQFLRSYVGDLIDLDNARAALLLAGGAAGDDPEAVYIVGGRRLSRESFEAAARSGSVAAAGQLMAGALDESPATELRRHAGDIGRLERAFERTVGDRLRAEARRDPLGPAPFLLFCHRLRAQATLLTEIVWSVELGRPPARADGVSAITAAHP